MRFAHLTLTKKDCEKLNLKVMTIDSVLKTLKKIEKEKMKKYYNSYCWDAVWDLMQNRCIIVTEGRKVLVFKTIFDKILKIYKRKNSDYMSFYDIKEFDPIMAMFARNQVTEC